ncbi:MAG: hypothetical protein OEU86_02055, partial [Gammaproteobacteria bacterium]|nr:hypothetical protein [Gammaproteobacteria bacterium]
LILVVVLGVVRPLLRNLSNGISLSGSGGGAARQQVAMTGGAAVSAPTASSAGYVPAAAQAPPAPLTFDDKISVARQATESDPERVAQIVRGWVQNDD